MVNPITNFAQRFAKIHGNLFAQVLERSQLTIKLALAERMNKEITALHDRFAAPKSARVEKQIDELFAKKETIAASITNVKAALKKINDVRIIVLEMRVAAQAADTTTFDLKMDALNDKVGSAVIDPDNLIGNPGPRVTATTNTIVGTERLQTTVASAFLGSDWSIERDDGAILTPDFENKRLNGISFADYTLVSLSGSTIEYQDGIGGTRTGTLTRRGGEILSAWMYGNFVQQADIDRAVADIDAAMKRIDEAERNFRINAAVMNSALGQVTTRMQALTDEFNTLAAEELDARQAEERAITLRFDLAVNSLSLTSEVSVNYVQSLFLSPSPMEKQTIFGILGGTDR